MSKKVNQILNSIIAAFVGALIGHAIYTVVDVHNRPTLYAVQSAPWYLSILLQCAVTAVAVGIAVGIKLLLKRKNK